MQHDPTIRAAAAGAVLFLRLLARADEAPAIDPAACREWFGETAQLTPMALAATNAAVSEVVCNGQTAGWVFRTDQVPPVCKGKRGEIAVLVALGLDGRIRGLRVLSHKEDPKYFGRLKAGFFQQFLNQRPDSGVKIDAVTQATYSSKAIISDVMDGAKLVIALPEVAVKVKRPEDCSLTKTANMPHN